jgi:hypothetical protein
VTGAMKCLRVQISQQTIDLHVPYEIADDLYLLHSGLGKFSVGKLFLDQYHQFKPIKGIKLKIVSKVRFICNSFDINT